MEKMSEVISYLLESRRNLIKLILTALLLAIGASIIASYLSNLLNEKQNLLLIIGLSVVFLALFYLVYELLKKRIKTKSIESLIAIENSSNDVIKIPRYSLSEKLNSTLKAAFIENEALKNIWYSNKNSRDTKQTPTNNSGKNNEARYDNDIKYFAIVRIETDNPRNESQSEKLLIEIIEYLIIEELSNHLSSYFNDYTEANQFVKRYTRADFPQILLENRIINMLSTPFQDRAIFAKANMAENPPKGEICSIMGTDGSYFTSFDLILPVGTKVEKISDGHLKLENKRLILEIKIINEGFSGIFPYGFEYNYLGFYEKDKISIKSIKIEIKSIIKPLSLMLNKGWEYHKWVDSFTKEIINFASFNTFIKRINWETNLTNIVVSNNRKKIRNILSQKDKTENSKQVKESIQSSDKKV